MPIQDSSTATPRLDLGVAFLEYHSQPSGFAGLQILPVFGVAKPEAVLSVITRETLLTRADTKRSRSGAYNRVNLAVGSMSYKCQEHGIEAPLGDDDRVNYAEQFDAELVTTEMAWLKLMMEFEARVAAEIFDATTNWPSDDADLFTDRSSAPWDSADSDIISHVRAAKEKVRKNCGVAPNALIVGATTLVNILNNTGVKAMFPSTVLLSEEVLRGSLKAIFGVEKLIVGGNAYNSAKEGQDFSGSDFWSDDYAMVAVVANGADASMATPCVGRTMLWTPDSPEHVTVESYREEQTRSDIFRCRHFIDEKIIDPYFAHLMGIDG